MEESETQRNASSKSSITFGDSEVLSAEIIQPEILLSQWTAASFVLMTTSLLFYHMTRVSSLEMNPRIAGLISVAMIIMSIVFEVQALVVYVQRVSRMDTVSNATLIIKSIRTERKVSKSYIAVISILVLVQLFIAWVIVSGSFKKLASKHQHNG
tara:strand:- start:561 stop:1025 length:465 start_codon:yes stop_codon:yes gene_type:complete